jgi:hypothetical protein
MTVALFNQQSLNQQAAEILNQHRVPYDQETELAALVLIRTALEKELLDVETIQEPELLIAKLAADPALAMSLMTETEPGDEFSMELSETLAEAAAEILEEIVASLTARTPVIL